MTDERLDDARAPCSKPRVVVPAEVRALIVTHLGKALAAAWQRKYESAAQDSDLSTTGASKEGRG